MPDEFWVIDEGSGASSRPARRTNLKQEGWRATTRHDKLAHTLPADLCSGSFLAQCTVQHRTLCWVNQMWQYVFLAALGVTSSVLAPVAQAADLKTVGVLCHCRSDLPMLKAFETGLAKLSLRDGETVQLIRHTSDGDPARLARQAEEIVRQKPDVIFAGFTPAVIALKRHTTSIPVVFAG